MNKISAIEGVLLEYEPDVLIVTETWLNECIENCEFLPPNYTAYRRDRESRGGGVAVICKRSTVCTERSSPPEIECIACDMTLYGSLFTFIAVYRPPDSSEDYMLSFNDFLQSVFQNSKRKIVMAGDFNLPYIDWVEYKAGQVDVLPSRALLDVVFSLNMVQVVQGYTRVHEKGGSLLDLVFLSPSLAAQKYTCEVMEGISDHSMVILQLLGMRHEARATKSVLVPDYSRADDVSILDFFDVDYEDFKRIAVSDSSTVDDAWIRFKETVHILIKRYIPERKKKVQRMNPWVSRKIIHMKRDLRRMRAKRKNSKQSLRSADVTTLSLSFKAELADAKKRYMNESLTQFIKTAPQKFWRYLSKEKSNAVYLTNENGTVTDSFQLACTFNDYFESVFTNDDGILPEFSLGCPASPITDIVVTKEGTFF